MVFKVRLPLVCLLLFALLLVSVSGTTDPELKTCKHQCRAQQQADEGQVRVCVQKCDEYHREKQRRAGEREEGGGSMERLNPEYDPTHHDPEKEYRRCQKQCQRETEGRYSQQRCQRHCEEERRRSERGRGEGGRGSSDEIEPQENPTRRDPEREYRACQQKCQQGEPEGRERCQRRCEEERRRSERGRGEGGRGISDEFDSEENPTRRDPEREYRACQQKCQQGEPEGRERCQRRCEEERRRSERERGEGGRRISDEFDSEENPTRSDPEREYRACQQKCQQREQEGRERCQRQCERQRRESERGRGRGGEDKERYEEGRRREEEEEQQGEYEENPYVFQDEHFSTPIQTQHGRVRILQRFTERSRLLRGIENYRLTILEAEPQTFIVPYHWDAEAVFFVARGRGTVSMVRPERRESFNIRRGDIVRIPAGTTTYLINRDNDERLVIAKLLQPVSTPGRFESFFGAGGENPESFYRAFSNEILEAAFNTKRDRLQRLFGQQRQGIIIKASQEQIRALSHHEEGGIWPFGGEHKGTINIFQQRPSQVNQYGRLHEVAPDDYRQLQDLDIAVSYLNLTQGAMAGPEYTSKATKISLVVNGEGYFEMACPHLSSQSGGRRESPREWGGRGGSERQTTGGTTSYQKVSTRLRRGTVVVVPAGHPFVTVASSNQNLEVVCFEVNARNSWKFTLAGRNNVINQLEREAKELAFGVPSREVEEVFNSQQEEFFFKGPGQQQQEGRGYADA